MPSYSVQMSFERLDLISQKGDDDPKREETTPHPGKRVLGGMKDVQKSCHGSPLRSYWLLLGGLALLTMIGWAYATVNQSPEEELEGLRTRNQEIEGVLGRIVTHFNNSELLFATVDLKDEPGIKLVIQLGSQLNGRNGKLETPLIRSAELAVGQDKTVTLNMVKSLIENGADAYAQDNKGQTFLHKLVSPDGGNKLTPAEFHDVVEYLVLKNESNLFNVPEASSGSTPLMWAVTSMEVDTETLTLLHSNGVSFLRVDKHGNSLLYYALDGKRSGEVFQDLMNLGLDWTHLNNYNHSMLHLAAHLGNVDGLRRFLDLDLDPNFKDSYESTALHQIAFYGKENALEGARILIQNGANVDMKDQGGMTPIQYAKQRGDDLAERDELVKLLEENHHEV